jgi:hypothetical protein
MATKKEIAKEKAIKDGLPSDVADNIFRMQMGKHASQNTPGTFRVKDQKTMAMSTMFQTPNPDGTLDLSTPDQNISYLEVDEVEIPASRKVEKFADDPQAFFNTMANEAASKGWTGSVADYIKQKEQDLGYRGRTSTIETEVTDTLPGENYQANVFGAFSQGFDNVGGSDKNKTGGGSSKGSGKSGMVDTFSALDTRQGKRKVAIEERMQLQDARGEKKQQRKTDRLGRKEEKQAFKELKKQARQDRRQARKDLNQAKRNNRKDTSATRDAFMANPNISGADGFGLKSGMVSSDRSVADAKARLEAAKSNLKSTRKNRPDTPAEQRRQRKQTFQDTRKRLASERAAENRKIVEQGKAQRSAGKNPLTTKEFDPSSPIFMAKRKMSFRK